MSLTTHHYDVIIIGAGHAGSEAALASARIGCSTLMITLTIDSIGLMPCNPSIGGPAKGQIVGEIDALGGEMGYAADHTILQMKVLNRSRGPAVQCLRSQNDKLAYKDHMKQALLAQDRLTVIEAEVSSLLIEDTHINGVQTADGQHYLAPTVIITTGTFLKAKMHVGLNASEGGRLGEDSANHLSSSLRSYFRLGRLKTGTPPRLIKDTIDFSKMVLQPGDPEFLRFSFKSPYSNVYQSQLACHLTHTTEASHDLILNNLDRSPLFTKIIQGVGPRYCPSIEDKIVRFKDKPSHHIFIEPETRHGTDMYPQGLNTSLPSDVQTSFLHTMPGLEDVKISHYGYAVEYDFVYPDQLYPTLETKAITGLFFAGQINGTSGYEEAAGQGIVAGINAALKAQRRDPFILKREDSFIGTLIDDLITKNIYEPYRMLTSRSEYRLLLRQDNAIFRLSEKAFDIGLLSKSDIETIRSAQKAVRFWQSKWETTSTTNDQVSTFKLHQKIRLSDLIKRPEVTLKDIETLNNLSHNDKEAAERALVNIKYEGYIKKQALDIQRLQKFENKRLPDTIDFDVIKGLKTESRLKFQEHKPKTIYDAKHIAGINPADLMILITYLEKYTIPSS